MGLDMYLFRREKGSSDDDEQELDEVAYWRKANQIRRWFDENIEGGVENVTEHPVTKELIQKLVTDVQKALDVMDKNGDPSKYLPTQEGFFFGSTDYGEYYRYDLESTVKMMTKALENWDDSMEYYYYEWW